MEKNRSTKIIAMVALFVAVVGLGLGFAAFSNSLKIQSTADVSPDEATFNVDFSSSDKSVVTQPIVPSKTGDFEATSATINNASDPTISGLGATFTEPGQSVTYTFYAVNDGEYDAYLNSIDLTSLGTCTAGTGTTNTLVQAACDDIKIKIKVGDDPEYVSSNTNISSHLLAKDHGEPIVVTISYDSNGDRADGDFQVQFEDITLSYSTVD